MATARWVRFRDPLMLRDRMNHALGDLVVRPRRGTEQEDLAAGPWTPPVDTVETRESIIILADVPGIARNALDAAMKEKSLSSRANAGPRKRRRNYHRVERADKNFRRIFPLPMAVRHDHIQAVLKNGVLEVTVMKEEQAKPK